MFSTVQCARTKARASEREIYRRQVSFLYKLYVFVKLEIMEIKKLKESPILAPTAVHLTAVT